MKIVSDKKFFYVLNPGDFFVFDGMLYIKVSDKYIGEPDRPINAFNCFTNEAVNVVSNIEVEVREGKIIIEV